MCLPDLLYTCDILFCRFCPSVFFYLASVVPAIWFLELYNMEERIKEKNNQNTTIPVKLKFNKTEEDLTVDIKGVM